jgi:hypothetical protein
MFLRQKCRQKNEGQKMMFPIANRFGSIRWQLLSVGHKTFRILFRACPAAGQALVA